MRTTTPRPLTSLREARICGDEGWTAELHDHTPLDTHTFMRLACECGLVVAKTNDEGDPLDVGRWRRTVSPQLLRARPLVWERGAIARSENAAPRFNARSPRSLEVSKARSRACRHHRRFVPALTGSEAATAFR